MLAPTSVNVNPSEKVVVDPVCRIEGHLRLELQAADQVIKNAWISTTQYRGIETIACNRDPRDVWAFVERICGVCTGSHAAGSILAVEDALQYPIPVQAKLIRDLMNGALQLHDHAVHFYQLEALDWVDVVSALKGDPQEAASIAHSLSDWPESSAQYFAGVKKTLQESVEYGQLSIFTNGYWGHPAYKLPPSVNLMAIGHYLQALSWQRDVVKIHTIFGGKNPHPNWLVGGMACAINMDNYQTVNQYAISTIEQILQRAHDFITKVYYPDAIAIAQFYKDYFYIGASNPNLFCTAGPALSCSGKPTGEGSDIKPGVFLDGDYKTVHAFDQDLIAEFVTSSWYDYTVGNDVGLAPYDGQTHPDYTGPIPPYNWLSDHPKYTWVKAPRYDGHAMAVGPNARMMMGYAQGVPRIMERMNEVFDKLSLPRDNGLMNSTMGRTYCRALEAVITIENMINQMSELVSRIKSGQTTTFNPAKWEPETWPSESKGVGWVEAPRGSLSHWVRIKDGLVSNYQCVVPSTWNSSGRDPKGQMGPFEYSLAASGKHPLVNPSQPLEPLRTIHSYDPCQSCAVHLFDELGNQHSTHLDP